MKRKLPSKDKIRKYICEFGEEVTKYIDERYGIDLEKYGDMNVKVSFNRLHKISFAIFRRRNKKYVPLVVLSLSEIRRKHKNTFFEYDHLNHVDKKRIGTIYSVSWKKYVRALITHEVSHLVEQIMLGVAYYDKKDKILRDYDNKDVKKFRKKARKVEKPFSDQNFHHGPMFCAVYRDMRDKFVNGKRK